MSIYKGWDVHSYTSDICSLLQSDEHRNTTLTALTGTMETSAVQTTIDEILTRCNSAPVIKAMLDKMIKRSHYNNDTTQVIYTDPDVMHINIWRLLMWCWRETHDECVQLFFEMLVDAGQTCVQGDSHRLFMYLFSRLQEKEKEKK